MLELETTTVTYKGYGLDVTLVVGTATAMIGIKRARLRMEGHEKFGGVNIDFDKYALFAYVYPDFVSCVIKAEGFEHWPLTYDEFGDLPVDLYDQWEKAVYKLNPHWLNIVEPVEKKE